MESLSHPGKVVGPRKVPALNPFWFSFRPAGKGQGRDGVGPNGDIWEGFPERGLWLETILAVDGAALELAVPQISGPALRFDAQELANELRNSARKLARFLRGPLDLHQEPGVCDFQQYLLAIWGILRVKNANGGASLYGSHICNNKVNTISGVSFLFGKGIERVTHPR